MKSKMIVEDASGRTFVVVLDAGEKAFSAITKFAATLKLPGAPVTALGAFEKATLGWFDLGKKDYRKIEIGEQCEALSLLGDVAVGDDGKQSLHIHAVLGLRDGSTRGGHLIEAIVRPTLEVMVSETPKGLRRKKRSDLGIALIDLSD
jgi:hypothetical protein